MVKQKQTRPAVILLVDDNPDDQELARLALQHGKFYNELYIARDGREALDFIYHQGKFAGENAPPAPDIVLLDLNMPRMNGKEFLRTLREDPNMKSLPVVVLTTSRQESDVQEVYEIGCNSYMAKPMNRSEMVRLFEFLDMYWIQMGVLPKELR